MRTLGPRAPAASDVDTTRIVSVPLTAPQPGAGRERTVMWAVCAVRASTRRGPTTVPAVAGCSVATMRTLPPTIAAPWTETVRSGCTSVRAVAVTPPADAVHRLAV